MLELLLSKAEKAASAAVTSMVSGFLPKAAQSLDLGALLSQLRGDAPADPLLHKAMAVIATLSEQDNLYPVSVKLVLDALEARGVPREGVVGLATKAARLTGVDLSGQQGDDIVARLLTDLATRVVGRKTDYMGALVVCPHCNFTQIV